MKIVKKIPLITKVMPVLLGLSVVSCNRLRPASSSNKTLDQFAGSSATYDCSGNDYLYEDEIVSKYTSLDAGQIGVQHAAVGSSLTNGQKEAVKSALSAVPGPIKKRVFKDVKVQIKLTRDVTAACVGTAFASAYASRKPFASCYKLEKETGTATIYVSDQPHKIRQTLVRAIGYYLAEVDVALKDAPEVNAVFIDRTSAMNAAAVDRADLGIAFLNDAAASGFKLSIFARLLPDSILDQSIGLETRTSRWKQLEGPATVQRSQFSSYAVAEAFDSQYCHKDTRAVLAEKFHCTSVLLGLASSDPKKKCSQSSGTSVGLSLGASFPVANILAALFTHAGHKHGPNGEELPPETPTKPKQQPKAEPEQKPKAEPEQKSKPESAGDTPSTRKPIYEQPKGLKYFERDSGQYKAVPTPTSGNLSNYVVYDPQENKDADGAGNGTFGVFKGYKNTNGEYRNIASGTDPKNAVYQWFNGEGKPTDLYAEPGPNNTFIRSGETTNPTVVNADGSAIRDANAKSNGAGGLAEDGPSAIGGAVDWGESKETEEPKSARIPIDWGESKNDDAPQAEDKPADATNPSNGDNP